MPYCDMRAVCFRGSCHVAVGKLVDPQYTGLYQHPALNQEIVSLLVNVLESDQKSMVSSPR